MKKTLAGIITLLAVIVLFWCVADIVALSHKIAISNTSWRGGNPGTESTDYSISIGSTALTPANSFEWSLPGSAINLLAAVTPSEQEQGLGDLRYLASSTGMFFIFNQPGNYGFWMKGMEFPLDIIWLDQNFKIVHIENDLSTSTYPDVFYPDALSRYVIEVNAGIAKQYDLSVGQTMQIYQR
ncbi:MAG: DUF192 domain-containing protein [Patescibacteria group bacterium]|nr:DUF192 domain-containing protein [Patescibacteria group bacterium]